MKKFVILLLISIFITSLNAQHEWTSTNPGGGGAICMLGATANGDIVAGGDLSGTYITRDTGATWEVLGAAQGLTEDGMFSYGFHPTDGNTFILGTGIGAFKTIDGGDSIYRVDIETDPDLGLGIVETIGMAISDENIGYMAHYEWWLQDLSFLKTTDAGDSWNKVSFNGLPDTARIVKIIVHAMNPELIYVVTGKARFGCSQPKLYKSSDGGKNWAEIGATYPAILDVDLHPTDQSIVYMTTFEAEHCDTAMWKYVIDDGHFYKSENGGTSFTQIMEHTGIISVGTNPDNISVTGIFNYWNEEVGTWKTTDGGDTWLHTGYVNNWDIGWANPNYAYVTSFYGLNKTLTKNRFNPDNLNGSFGQWGWISTDGGTTIDNLTSTEVTSNHFHSNGLENVEGNAIDVSQINPMTVYAGYYDIGFWYSNDGGDSWKMSMPDKNTYADYSWWDGGGTNCNFVVNDPAREAVVWASFGAENYSTLGAIFKSTAFGENWQLSNTGLDPMGLNTHGLSIDLTSDINNRTLFVTQAGDIWRSTNDGSSWSKVFVNGGLKFTEVNKMDGQIVYAGGENGLFKSTDGGDNWDKIALGEGFEYIHSDPNAIYRDDIVPTNDELYDDTPTYAWRGVFDIKTDPSVPDRIFVSVHKEGKGLYRSDDAGQTWVKKYDNNKMRGIAIAPNNSNIVYAGSSLNYHNGGYDSEDSKGILVSYDAGDTWTPVNNGLAWPNGGRIDIESGTTPKVWVMSPGTGIKYSTIPNFTSLAVSENSFSGYNKQTYIQLKWKIQFSPSLNTIEIERKTDNGQWKKIGAVSSIDQNDSINFYTYNDTNPNLGNNYYRLKDINHNGSFSYSNTIIVHFNKDEINIFPNPAQTDIKIETKLSNIDNIKIYNNAGQLVINKDDPTSYVNIESLPKGVYTVLIRIGTKLTYKQVVVQ